MSVIYQLKFAMGSAAAAAATGAANELGNVAFQVGRFEEAHK
jgi:hypothetical protein